MDEMDAMERIEEVAKRGPVGSAGPLKIWSYGGKLYASGLFKMADQEGFSLCDSIVQCRERGIIPCLGDFRAEAIKAGWARDKIDEIIKSALADAGGL